MEERQRMLYWRNALLAVVLIAAAVLSYYMILPK